MSATQIKYSYQDLLTAPDDGNRYEIFEGELIVTPSPSFKHQNTISNLLLILGNYIKKNNLGKLITAPMDVYFDEETVVEPDLLFIRKNRSHIIEEQRVQGGPDLIVEILSPGTADRDRGFKFRRYAKEGVKEYWLVDPEEESLEVFHLTEKGYELENKFTDNVEVTTSAFAELHFYLDELWQ